MSNECANANWFYNLVSKVERFWCFALQARSTFNVANNNLYLGCNLKLWRWCFWNIFIFQKHLENAMILIPGEAKHKLPPISKGMHKKCAVFLHLSLGDKIFSTFVVMNLACVQPEYMPVVVVGLLITKKAFSIWKKKNNFHEVASISEMVFNVSYVLIFQTIFRIWLHNLLYTKSSLVVEASKANTFSFLVLPGLTFWLVFYENVCTQSCFFFSKKHSLETIWMKGPAIQKSRCL